MFLTISLVGPNLAESSLMEKEVLAKFVAGEFSYKNGDYSKAIENYQLIIDGGWESGSIYYNLGNSYFRQGKIGKAILYFERARLFIPRDSDLQFNEKYARSSVGIQSLQGSSNVWENMFLNWTGFYTIEEMVLVFTFLMFGLGLVHLGGLYGR